MEQHDPVHDPQAVPGPDGIIEIHDPEIDVEAIMARIRETVAQRRAEGAYREDLDLIADRARSLAGSSTSGSDDTGLPALLDEMNDRWVLEEQPFTSRAPVVGRLIVAVRSFWNWMSTKWYVRALAQQQMGFNSATARAYEEMARQQRQLADQVRALQQAVAEQQRALDRLAAAGGPPEPGSDE